VRLGAAVVAAVVVDVFVAVVFVAVVFGRAVLAALVAAALRALVAVALRALAAPVPRRAPVAALSGFSSTVAAVAPAVARVRVARVFAGVSAVARRVVDELAGEVDDVAAPPVAPLATVPEREVVPRERVGEASAASVAARGTGIRRVSWVTCEGFSSSRLETPSSRMVRRSWVARMSMVLSTPWRPPAMRP
jgi:hypothetical protein